MKPAHTLKPISIQAPPIGSLIGGLCREMGHIRDRSARIALDLRGCQAKTLITRLGEERQQLHRRQQELQSMARQLQRQAGLDPLGLEFLLEITSRNF